MRGSIRRAPALPVVASLLAAALLAGAGCAPRGRTDTTADDRAAADAAYRQEIAAWHRQREERLTRDDGWLTLAGLHWLPEGRSTIGSAPMDDVVLPPSAPLQVGTLHREGDRVRLEVEPGVEATHDGERFRELEMVSDAAAGDAGPTVVELGSLSFHVIRRGDKLGVRVKDSDNPARTGFRGVDTFPVDPAWRLDARFEPYDTPRPMPIDDVTGNVQDAVSPGEVTFTVDGTPYRLIALDEDGDLFLIFSDATSGKETYGAGRYLTAPRPGPDGRLVLDFNKAYNPPCAFTPFATCPLPPRQNRLPIAVRAGEKKFTGPGAH